LSRTPLTE